MLHAFVLMDNHYHFLVETTDPNLCRAMQWLNVSYSVWFNRRHGRSGHLFQGWADFRDQYGDWGRDLALYLGRKECGLKLNELAEAAGGIDATSAGAAVKRFEPRLFKVPRLARAVAQARTLLEEKLQTQ